MEHSTDQFVMHFLYTESNIIITNAGMYNLQRHNWQLHKSIKIIIYRYTDPTATSDVEIKRLHTELQAANMIKSRTTAEITTLIVTDLMATTTQDRNE